MSKRLEQAWHAPIYNPSYYNVWMDSRSRTYKGKWDATVGAYIKPGKLAK